MAEAYANTINRATEHAPAFLYVWILDNAVIDSYAVLTHLDNYLDDSVQIVTPEQMITLIDAWAKGSL